MFWTISFLWGVLCSLPHTLGTTSPLPGNRNITLVGLGMFVLGFLVEATADFQKWQFKQQSESFCSVGLWRYSQHPNYFGNLLLWCGILVMNAPALNSTRLALSFLCPLFMWYLLSGQANGTITNAAAMELDRHGGDPEYMRYIATVPKIIPNPFL